jgi:hypothetical protein
MSARIDPETRRGRRWLIAGGFACLALMAFPFFCDERRGCGFAVAQPWSAMGWSAKAAIALFVAAGLAAICSGLRWRMPAAVAGIVVVLLFAVLANSIVFGLAAPACGPVIGALRAYAEVPVFIDCRLWPTIAALCIDAFFIGFAAETLRARHLPAAWRQPLKPWTQGLVLAGVAPVLLLMLVLLIPAVGADAVKASWRKWRRG